MKFNDDGSVMTMMGLMIMMMMLMMTWLFIMIPVDGERNFDPKQRFTVDVTATASPDNGEDYDDDDADLMIKNDHHDQQSIIRLIDYH